MKPQALDSYPSEMFSSCKDGDTTSRGAQGKTSKSGLGPEPCLERELGLLSVWSVAWKMFPN